MKKKHAMQYALWGILFSICILCSAVGGNVLSASRFVRAAELTNDSIREKEAQISAARSEREQMKSTLSDMQAVKEQLESSKSSLESYVTQLDASLTDIQLKIDALKQNIEDKEAEIDRTEQELDEAVEVQQAQYESMKKRIQFMYERGQDYFLEFLLSAGSFGEMLNKAFYISQLSAYDQNKLNEFKEQTRLVKLTKEALEAERETLEEARAQQETEEANVESLIAAKNAEIGGVASELEGANQTIEQYAAEMAQQDAEIAALESAVAAEKAKLAAENQIHYGGGPFVWPAPGYTYISSPFGWRTHPLYGNQRFHNGVDMAAPSGSPILSAYDGRVVAASYSPSMGNYVMIDHGDGLYTIYMHASALYVSEGTSVSAGQQIAAVGSTGNSTGPHLHFSVRLNGEYQNPMNYL